MDKRDPLAGLENLSEPVDSKEGVKENVARQQSNPENAPDKENTLAVAPQLNKRDNIPQVIIDKPRRSVLKAFDPLFSDSPVTVRKSPARPSLPSLNENSTQETSDKLLDITFEYESPALSENEALESTKHDSDKNTALQDEINAVQPTPSKLDLESSFDVSYAHYESFEKQDFSKSYQEVLNVTVDEQKLTEPDVFYDTQTSPSLSEFSVSISGNQGVIEETLNTSTDERIKIVKECLGSIISNIEEDLKTETTVKFEDSGIQDLEDILGHLQLSDDISLNVSKDRSEDLKHEELQEKKPTQIADQDNENISLAANDLGELHPPQVLNTDNQENNPEHLNNQVQQTHVQDITGNAEVDARIFDQIQELNTDGIGTYSQEDSDIKHQILEVTGDANVDSKIFDQLQELHEIPESDVKDIEIQDSELRANVLNEIDEIIDLAKIKVLEEEETNSVIKEISTEFKKTAIASDLNKIESVQPNSICDFDEIQREDHNSSVSKQIEDIANLTTEKLQIYEELKGAQSDVEDQIDQETDKLKEIKSVIKEEIDQETELFSDQLKEIKSDIKEEIDEEIEPPFDQLKEIKLDVKEESDIENAPLSDQLKETKLEGEPLSDPCEIPKIGDSSIAKETKNSDPENNTVAASADTIPIQVLEETIADENDSELEESFIKTIKLTEKELFRAKSAKVILKPLPESIIQNLTKTETVSKPCDLCKTTSKELSEVKTKMADINDMLISDQQEISDLKLKLNASQQAKASLELEIRQKEEIIIKTQAEALKNEQTYKQEIKQLKELLKQQESKSFEKANGSDLEQALKEAKAKEAQAVRELNAKTRDDYNTRKVMEEYEKTIAARLADYQKLKEEYETATRHLSNLELAFSDVHQKYERSKTIIQGFKVNEETLQKNLLIAEESLRRNEEKYQSLKAHAKAQIEKSNTQILSERDAFDGQVNKLKAIIKRLEIKCCSVEHALAQKNEECIALAALCDEVTGKRI